MSLAFLGYSGRDRLAASMRDLDSIPGNLCAIHLALSCAWLVSFGIGRAPEGILFACLVGVSLLRLPRTLPLLVESIASCRPVLACMVLLLWIGISAAWSPPEAGADWYPPRHILYPVLLAPLLARWRLLVCAYLTGVTFQACWILIEYAFVKDYHYGYPLGSSSNVHFWGGHMATAVILAACMTLDSSIGRFARTLSIVVFALCLSSALTIAGRTTAVAIIAGLVCAVTWAIARGRLGWRLPFMLFVGTAICAVMFGSTLGKRFQKVTAAGPSVAMLMRLHDLTSGRTWMWQTTIQACEEHPVTGWGRDAWAVVFRAKLAELPPDELYRPIESLRTLNTAHSTYVQAVVDQGMIGLLMLGGALLSLATTAWRSGAGVALPLFSLTAYWVVSSITLSELNTSHGLIPFGFMMTFGLGTTVFAGRGRTIESL